MPRPKVMQTQQAREQLAHHLALANEYVDPFTGPPKPMDIAVAAGLVEWATKYLELTTTKKQAEADGALYLVLHRFEQLKLM